MSDVKCQSASHIVLDPSWSNKISKGNPSARHWSLFKIIQLTWIDEVVWDWMELKLIADDFLNEFPYGIEKDNGFERFRRIIQFFVRFGDDYGYGSFEVGRPIT